MKVPQRQRYVVAFDVVTQFGDVQHRGEIDFASYDEAHLEFQLHCALGLIGHPGSCCKQYTLQARAAALWKIGRNGKRMKVPIPKAVTELEASPVSHRQVLQRMSDLACVCEDPSTCRKK
jgi:hypothetical protein